ncbi:S8 family peptidase [Streptomyces sp. JJ66]|uniref:S8 family peptidase n=1 Tax=Streptomyces sp. JJ66 TaxID=2803843 RepID=UPI001C56E721|nr:S8 family peptidase [Streptomyces sp. JJ66]MBW1603040.1 S8 family peptidase [Streptomyces sp. JJ66]
MFRSLARRLGLLTAAALLPAPLAFAASPGDAVPEPGRTVLAPLYRAADPIPGQYLITLDQGSQPAKLAKDLGIDPHYVYESAVLGFAATLTDRQLAIVRRVPGVAAVEQDAVARATRAPSAVPRAAPRTRGTAPHDTQPVTSYSVPPVTPHPIITEALAPAASWGLDRIDQRELPLDDEFTVEHTGAGVTAYVMDTGIDYQHTEFGGRAAPGFDSVRDGRGGADCHGHGTHVAGTIGGTTYGVAREVKLVSVRVLNCQGRGSTSGIIAGFDWVAKDAANATNAARPAVLNASLGSSYSYATNAAAASLANSGVLPVVAAGNENQNACNVSPASAPQALTVGATNRQDQEAPFSNHGPCLDLYAPGTDIVSARLNGGSVALSGTSMASPHAAGVAALYLDQNGRTSSSDLAAWITSTASTDQVGNIGPGSPNRLLYTGGL